MSQEMIGAIANGIARLIFFVFVVLPTLAIFLPWIWRTAVPGLFPRAVKDGYIVEKISRTQAIEIAIAVLLFGLIIR